MRSQLAFCPVLEELYDARSLTGRTGREFDALGCLSSVNTLLTLRSLQLELRPRRTLETGLGFGGSCLTLASVHRECDPVPRRQHLAIDPYQADAWDDVALVNLERAGLDGYVEFRPGRSSQELAELAGAGQTFELVYIDGSHLFEDVFVDFYFADRLLPTGGIVLFDDSADPHIQKVIRFIRRNLSSGYEELDLGPYRPDGGRSLRYRVARRLRRNQLTGFRRRGPSERRWDAPLTRF